MITEKDVSKQAGKSNVKKNVLIIEQAESKEIRSEET